MSDAKRQLDELLEEVDKLFEEKGLSQAVESFLTSEQVTAKVAQTTQRLINNMRKMEERAPDEKVKGIAKNIREGFEANTQTLADDVVASFKVSLAGSLELMLQFTGDIADEEVVLDMVRENISAKGMEDIEDICSNMVIKNSKSFMSAMYRGYTPPGMTEDVVGFIQALFGDVMIPITAIFPDLGKDDDTDNGN